MIKAKVMPTILIAMLLMMISFSAVGTEKAYACSCVEFESYTAAMEMSSHVLDATVDGLKDGANGYVEVSLSVASAWKGTATKEMKVLTFGNSASCGYHFEIGKRYAVFAYEQKDALHVSLCSATSLLEDDSPIFEELGNPEPVETEDNSGTQGVSGQSSDTGASAAADEQEENSPDQIKLKVTEEELEQRLETQKSQLTIVFASVGGLFLLGALVLLIIRLRRR